MYMRQRWNDQRLANVSKPTDTEALLISHRQDDTWMPDIFIKNDKVSMMSDVTTLYSFLRLDHKGIEQAVNLTTHKTNTCVAYV